MQTDSTDPPAEQAFKPSRYMRERRPYLYSDTTKSTQPVVTREILDHHLETLTSRKDETTFETFARRLVEKFITPNLRPQTGPTGGGDGKTDAETYPVAQTIALRWYSPHAAPAHERWAFAFSAKKRWRQKVQSDVAEIVGTGRGYPRIYFVTNQYAPGKDSAAEQDALQKKHGVPVTILDRTWILTHVFEHGGLDIAIEVLGVGAGTEREVETIGPEDKKRIAQLDALEKSIGDGTQYSGTPHALVDDCRHAALLARGLGKPRTEVDGRFLRAVRSAQQYQLPKLELAAIYDWAWTSFFWFDDFAALNSKYDEVEKFAIDSDTADDLERTSNLLMLLRNCVGAGVLTAESAKLEVRVTALRGALDRLRGDTSRPNNALHAHALSLLQEVMERVHFGNDDIDLSDLWDEFRSVIEASDGLGTFPFESIADTLTQVGEFLPESPAFDRLFETLTDKLALRRSEGEAAERNSTRAFQKLNKGLPYEAIRWFGRAVGLLVKDEYEDEPLRALVGSSIAYENAGLYWASRNYALAAVSHQFSAFTRTGKITEVNPAMLSRLFATELQIGRVPYILNIYYLWMCFSSARATSDKHREKLSEFHLRHSGSLAALLLKTSFADVPALASLPDALERLELLLPRTALLFLMGREDILRAEGSIPETETQEGYLEFFDQMAAFGAREIAAPRPDYLLTERVGLTSRVLGCDIIFSCANNITSIAVGEALLGALEALLATSLPHRTLPHLEQLQLRVDADANAGLRPTLTFIEEQGRTVGVITHAPQLVYQSHDEALTFPTWLQQATMELFLQFAVPQDHDAWAEAVLSEEQAFSRAITFANVPSAMNLIFGTNHPPLAVGEWIEDQDRRYEVARSTPWCPRLEPRAKKWAGPGQFSEEEPPEALRNLERLKHSDVRIVSPIDVRKWDAAKWTGTFFQIVPDSDEYAPCLGLTFLNREPAAAIFRGLRDRIGTEDKENALRIAIIRRVSTSNPHAYAVSVGPNLDLTPIDETTTFEFVSRINHMTPITSENLERFLAEYRRHGRYVLIPAQFRTRETPPELIRDFPIGKHHLIVREAWEIGMNDPDMMALDPDDPPIIPEDQTNAPALRAIERLRRMRDRRRDP
jgi:hypothetical protein